MSPPTSVSPPLFPGQRMARPSDYTEDMADRILHWIAEGRTLREFCRQKDTPAWRTVYDWQEAHPSFSARFARARDMGADAIAEETLEIANTPVEGVRREIGGKDGPKEVYEDMLGHRRLQVDTRLKLLAKWNPKKYGEKVETTHKGDAQSPIVISSTDAKL